MCSGWWLPVFDLGQNISSELDSLCSLNSHKGPSMSWSPQVAHCPAAEAAKCPPGSCCSCCPAKKQQGGGRCYRDPSLLLPLSTYCFPAILKGCF